MEESNAIRSIKRESIDQESRLTTNAVNSVITYSNRLGINKLVCCNMQMILMCQFETNLADKYRE